MPVAEGGTGSGFPILETDAWSKYAVDVAAGLGNAHPCTSTCVTSTGAPPLFSMAMTRSASHRLPALFQWISALAPILRSKFGQSFTQNVKSTHEPPTMIAKISKIAFAASSLEPRKAPMPLLI